MSALSDLLNRYLAKEKFRDLSNRKVADAAGVSRGTIDNYRKGIHPAAPSEDILQAFHDLLGIPVVELREAAGVPHGEPDPYVAPAEFNRLSQTQRDALDEFVRSFVGPQGVDNVVPIAEAASSRTSRQKKQVEEAPGHWGGGDNPPLPPGLTDEGVAASQGEKESDAEPDEGEAEGSGTGDEPEDPDEAR